MSQENSIGEKIVNLLRLYILMIQKPVNFVCNPAIELLSGYSETLGESARQLKRITINTIVLLPVTVTSVVAGLLITGESAGQIAFSVEQLRVLVSTLLAVSALVSIPINISSLDKSLKKSLYMSLLLGIGSYVVFSVSTPELYGFIAVIIYGLGAYVTEGVERYNPYPDEHIQKNLDTVGKAVQIATVIGILLVISGVSVLSYGQGLSESVFVVASLGLLTLSYIIPELQQPYIENVYAHANLRTNSQMWLLTPKVTAISSFVVTVFSGQLEILTLAGFLTPIATSILFATYMKYQTKESTIGNFYTDSDDYSDPLWIEPEKDVEFESSIDTEEPSTSINMNLSMEIPENIPDNSRPWRRVVLGTHGIYRSVKSIDELPNDFEQYYNKLCGLAYEEVGNSEEGIPWNQWPDELVNRIRSNIHRSKNANLQDIQDAEIRISEREIEDSLYAN